MTDTDMNTDEPAIDHSDSKRGYGSDGPAIYRVSPSTNPDRKNKIVARFPRPIVCWRMHESYFRFDSSVVLPTITTELRRLKPLVLDANGRPRDDRVSTIFAHADPVGDDEYNKRLSGRRARSFYALLIRNVDIWLELFPTVEGDHWGLESTQIMLSTLQRPDGSGPYYSGAVDGILGSGTDRGIRDFQRDNGLATDGVAGANTRTKLYLLYMDAICSVEGEPLVLTAEDFLGDPSRADGKAAYQGCSEFNPVRILSADEQKKLTRTARNARNAKNRRAIMFVFRRDDFKPVDGPTLASKWPCPTWNEPAGDCRKLHWKDAKDRLRAGDTEREYEQGERTMACSWYERFAMFSPCERPKPEILYPPVYFCAMTASVAILGAPNVNAAVIGQLNQGDLVAVVEEKFDSDTFFVRIERVIAPAQATYYDGTEQQPAEAWICVVRDGVPYAFWSNVDANSLSASAAAVDLDDRFVVLSPDV